MKKSRDRNLRTKITFKMKQKAFFITFNGLSIKQITQFFWKVRVRLKFTTLTFILLLPFKNKDRKHKKKIFQKGGIFAPLICLLANN